MSFKLKLKKKSQDVIQDYCEKCGEFGHTHRDCGMGITCYKCGKVGHHGRNCTEEIFHESLAVQSAMEQGQYNPNDAMWGDKRKQTGNEHITDWSERAAADRAVEEAEGSKRRLTEEDFRVREGKVYNVVLSPDEEAKRLRKEAKRRRTEEKHRKEEEERETVRRYLQEKKLQENDKVKEDHNAKREVEREARESEGVRKREEEKEKQNKHLERVMAQKMKKQGLYFTPPSWASPRRDKRLYISVERGGQRLEAWDVSEHPYYIIGKNKDVVDFPLDHQSISRVHLAIIHDGSKPVTYLQDLNSQWGTKCGGSRCRSNEPVKIAVGESFTVGGSSRTLVLKLRRPTPD